MAQGRHVTNGVYLLDLLSDQQTRERSLMDPLPEAHVSAFPPTPHAQLGGFG